MTIIHESIGLINLKPVIRAFKTAETVGAKEHPVYGGGRYLINIFSLKYCCLVKKCCCLIKKG